MQVFGVRHMPKPPSPPPPTLAIHIKIEYGRVRHMPNPHMFYFDVNSKHWED
jgi:hypothetical protein